jgi:hypothetical protein
VQIDKVSQAILGLISLSDEDGILEGIQHSQDPDNIPTTTCVVYSFSPMPFSDVFNEFLVEIAFWYDNPMFSAVSQIIDRIEQNSGNEWHDIIENESVIGRFQYFFQRSPLSGGSQSLKSLTLFIKIRAMFYVC